MAQILIVDNNDPVRGMLASLLQAKGYAVARAANGAQALTCCASQRFDLVVMDVYMPSMDGLETCRRLRKESQVPVLLLSASREPSIQDDALASGASAFSLKPMNFDRLLHGISGLISKGPSVVGGASLQAPLCFA